MASRSLQGRRWLIAYERRASCSTLFKSELSLCPMLTDIFAVRYEDRPIWKSHGAKEKRLLVQAFVVVLDTFPEYSHNSSSYKDAWQGAHDLVARELGIKSLSKTHWQDVKGGWHLYKIHQVCENFVCAPFEQTFSADVFMKRRLSFVEVALRARGNELAGRLVAHKKYPLMVESAREGLDELKSSIDELNERFKQAGAPLSYNDGFLQLIDDSLIEREIEAPFWELVSDEKWKNVSLDMAEALDLRDSGAKDPAYHAAKALESVIKIISDEKGWSTKTEKGAANYIDNLVAQKNGRFVEVWESELLKEYFKKVRNPMGHGAGSSEMPVLTKAQCDWAIQSAMSWTRSLVGRL